MLTIPPGTAARAILRGIELRRSRVLIGWTAWVQDMVARVAPSGHRRLVARIFARSG